MEAAFAGLIGGVVASGMLLAGRYFLIDNGLDLAQKMQLVNFIGWDAVIVKLPLVIAIGLLMPAMAAFVALRKYLRV
jgi:cell division transport system permease protein